MQAAALRKTLASNIRRLSNQRALTLNALADFAGVSRAQLYDVLACRKGATVDWIAKIAEVLETDPASLLQRSRNVAASTATAKTPTATKRRVH